MKKLLLSLSALALATAVSAQTNSELSGNDLTATSKGYLYSFKAPGNGNDVNVANCTNDANVWNAFGNNAASSITMNAAGGLEVTIPSGTGSATANTRVAAIRFTKGNCSILQTGSYGDFSANKTIFVKAKASASVDMSILVASDDAGWVTHDGAFSSGNVGTSSGIDTLTIADQSWNSKGKLTNVIGWELWLPAGTVTSSDVTITFEAIAFGDAQIPGGSSAVALEAAGGSVYPNPAGDVVNVSVAAASTVELTNLAGQVVAAGASNGAGVVTLNTAAVPAGVYVVVVKSATGVATSKVVVQ